MIREKYVRTARRADGRQVALECSRKHHQGEIPTTTCLQNVARFGLIQTLHRMRSPALVGILAVARPAPTGPALPMSERRCTIPSWEPWWRTRQRVASGTECGSGLRIGGRTTSEGSRRSVTPSNSWRASKSQRVAGRGSIRTVLVSPVPPGQRYGSQRTRTSIRPRDPRTSGSSVSTCYLLGGTCRWSLSHMWTSGPGSLD